MTKYQIGDIIKFKSLDYVNEGGHFLIEDITIIYRKPHYHFRKLEDNTTHTVPAVRTDSSGYIEKVA